MRAPSAPRGLRAGGTIGAVLVAVALLLLAGAPRDAEARAAEPRLDATSWLLLDARDGTELAARAAGSRRPIASTTKLMTTLLARRELRPGERLVVPRYAAAPAESVAGLRAGERLTAHDLVVAMLLPSANDAAVTVARGVAGSRRAFVAEMNATARELGLDDTHYANPIGLDQSGNYSTARDLAELALKLLEDRGVKRIVKRSHATLRSGSMPRRVESTNTLLMSDPSVVGVKTGHTHDAGYVLIAMARRHGIPLLSVVLGAPSEAARDAESEELLDYGFALYRKRRPLRSGEPAAEVPVRFGDEPLPLLAARGVRVRVRDDQRVGIRRAVPAEVEGPIPAGRRLGRAVVTVDGRVVGRVPLRAARAVEAPSVVDRLGGPPVAILIVVVAGVILLSVARARGRRGDRGAGRAARRRRRV